MRRLERVLHVIDKLNEWSGKVISLLYIPLIVIIIYYLIMRYAFNVVPIWAEETAIFCAGIAWVVGGGYVLLQGRHVKVEVLYERFSPRGQAIIDLITFPFFLIFIGLFLWKAVEYAGYSISTLEHSISVWRPPIYPIKIFFPIGAFLILIQGLAKFIRDLITATTGRKVA